MWSNFPQNIPQEDGYYYTQYFNEDLNSWMYKPLWFDTKRAVWTGPWPWNYWRLPEHEYDVIEADGTIVKRLIARIIFRGITVKQFDPESHAKYYTECGTNN